jgi:hypothetical protein
MLAGAAAIVYKDHSADIVYKDRSADIVCKDRSADIVYKDHSADIVCKDRSAVVIAPWPLQELWPLIGTLYIYSHCIHELRNRSPRCRPSKPESFRGF